MEAALERCSMDQKMLITSVFARKGCNDNNEDERRSCRKKVEDEDEDRIELFAESRQGVG